MTDMPQPFTDLERMLERMSQQLEASTRRWSPMDHIESWGDDFGAMRIDLARNDDAYVVTADLPGFERDDVDVSIDERTLRIEADTDESIIEDDHDVLRSERHKRSMSRMIRLPEEVDSEAASARLRNGVLTVTLPRRAFGGGTDIEVS